MLSRQRLGGRLSQIRAEGAGRPDIYCRLALPGLQEDPTSRAQGGFGVPEDMNDGSLGAREAQQRWLLVRNTHGYILPSCLRRLEANERPDLPGTVWPRNARRASAQARRPMIPSPAASVPLQSDPARADRGGAVTGGPRCGLEVRRGRWSGGRLGVSWIEEEEARGEGREPWTGYYG